MNISMQVLVVVAAACLCLVAGAPDGRLARKQQRPTRGFKNVEMMTARGFGKRDRPHTRAEQSFEAPSQKKFKPKTSMMVAYDFGKRSGNDDMTEVMDADDFLEILGAAPEKETMDTNDDKTFDSIPVELFVMEMINHPEFARSVVSKFIDVNQDGMLSLQELLRNTA